MTIAITRNLKIAFTVSLLLNLLALGVLGGAAIKRMSGGPPGMETLLPETRHMMARTHQHVKRDMKEEITEAKALRKELVDILTAEEFNEKAFDDAFADLSKLQREISARKAQGVKEMIGELSLEERRKMAVHLVDSIGGGYKGRHSGHKKKDKPATNPNSD